MSEPLSCRPSPLVSLPPSPFFCLLPAAFPRIKLQRDYPASVREVPPPAVTIPLIFPPPRPSTQASCRVESFSLGTGFSLPVFPPTLSVFFPPLHRNYTPPRVARVLLATCKPKCPPMFFPSPSRSMIQFLCPHAFKRGIPLPVPGFFCSKHRIYSRFLPRLNTTIPKTCVSFLPLSQFSVPLSCRTNPPST